METKTEGAMVPASVASADIKGGVQVTELLQHAPKHGEPNILADLKSYSPECTLVDMSNCDLGTVGFVADLLHLVLEGDTTLGELSHASLQSVRSQIEVLRARAINALEQVPRGENFPLPVRVKCTVLPGATSETRRVEVFGVDTIVERIVSAEYCSPADIPIENGQPGHFSAFAVAINPDSSWRILFPDGTHLNVHASQLGAYATISL